LMICSVVDEQTFKPKLIVISEEDEKYFEYEPVSLSRELISQLSWMDKIEVEEIVYSLIEQNRIDRKLVSGESLVIKYPSLSSEILPHLRNKKIDDLF
jgi:hypothetical protein